MTFPRSQNQEFTVSIQSRIPDSSSHALNNIAILQMSILKKKKAYSERFQTIACGPNLAFCLFL